MSEPQRLQMMEKLHAAARDGDVETISQLAQQPGFDVDVKSEDGFTSLMVAVKHGRFQSARMLLSYEANVDDNDNPVAQRDRVDGGAGDAADLLFCPGRIT